MSDSDSDSDEDPVPVEAWSWLVIRDSHQGRLNIDKWLAAMLQTTCFI